MAEVRCGWPFGKNGGGGHAKLGDGRAWAKRGILFTISVMLLAVSLLSFAVALAQQSVKNRHTAVALLEIDRAAYTYSFLEDSLVRIMSASMNVSVRNDTVLLNATLPALSQTPADLENFAAFEANVSDLNVSMDLSGAKSLSLVVQPSQAAISQDANYFYTTPLGGGQIKAYDVNLTFPAASIDAAAWQALAEDNSGSALPVHIRVQDASYAVNLDFHANLSRSEASLLNITQGGNIAGTVQFLPGSALAIWHGENIGLKASIGFTTPVLVEANGTISVVSAASRTGRIRVA